MNKNLYVFVSSFADDKAGKITVLTTSVKRAYVLIMRYFHDNNYVGMPKLLAI